MFAARRPTTSLVTSLGRASKVATPRSFSTALLRPSVGVAATTRSHLVASVAASNQRAYGLRFISETVVRNDGGLTVPPEDGIHPDQPVRMDLSVSLLFSVIGRGAGVTERGGNVELVSVT